jgi:hypothetical protein
LTALTNTQLRSQLLDASLRAERLDAPDHAYDGRWTLRPDHARQIRPDLPELLRLAAERIPTGLDEITTAPARTTDPATSKAAARSISPTNACGKLALAYYKARVIYGLDGLTARTAVKMAKLENLAAPWKRVSDLKAAGIVAWTGETDDSVTGAAQEILALTDHGVREVRRLMAAAVAEAEAAK